MSAASSPPAAPLPSALGFGLHLRVKPNCPRCGQPLVATEAPGIDARWDCPKPIPRPRKNRNQYRGCGWMGPAEPWPDNYEAAVSALWQQQRDAAVTGSAL